MQTTRYLKDLGIDISGLDLSEKKIKQARTLHPEINFRKGNILDLEFDNDSMAGIVAFYAIVHFSDEQVDIAPCDEGHGHRKKRLINLKINDMWSSLLK